MKKGFTYLAILMLTTISIVLSREPAGPNDCPGHNHCRSQREGSCVRANVGFGSNYCVAWCTETGGEYCFGL